MCVCVCMRICGSLCVLHVFVCACDKTQRICVTEHRYISYVYCRGKSLVLITAW